MSDNFENNNIEDGLKSKQGFLPDSGTTTTEVNTVVSARGTEDGLVLRIDGRAEWNEIQTELDEFLGGRRKFFAGGEVSLEWLERLPTREQSKDLEELLIDKYGLNICRKKKKSFRRVRTEKIVKEAETQEPFSEMMAEEIASLDDDFGQELLDKVDSLTQGFSFNELSKSFGSEVDPAQGPVKSRALSEELRQNYISRVSEVIEDELIYDGEANARIVTGTLRSGQKVETPFSLVVLGDVNPGADLTAGGDIIVIGSLRGTAHAGAYDDNSYDKIIVALQMQPVQLRIGSIISRGSSDKVSGAEVARIDNRRIVVETFNPRSFPLKKKG